MQDPSIGYWERDRLEDWYATFRSKYDVGQVKVGRRNTNQKSRFLLQVFSSSCTEKRTFEVPLCLFIAMLYRILVFRFETH